MKRKNNWVTIKNYRWWVVLITTSPMLVLVFFVYWLALFFECIHNFFERIMNSSAPKWFKDYLNWAKNWKGNSDDK